MSKMRLAEIVFFTLLAGASAMAQTSDELEHKYGRPDNHLFRRIGYEVRPGIIMSASFTRDGQACELVIQPKRSADSRADIDKAIPAATALEIIDELAPATLRGRLLGGMIFGNYTSWHREVYERVTVMKLLVGVGGPDEDLKVLEARVRWKELQCQCGP